MNKIIEQKTFPAKDLLESVYSPLNSSSLFNAMILAGLAEKKEYISSTGSGEIKSYISLTEAGSKFGINRQSQYSEKTEIRFYEHSFNELLFEVSKTLFNISKNSLPKEQEIDIQQDPYNALEDNDLNEVLITPKPQKRTECLIATFIDGYASGWEFAVKDSFMEALDIKLTDKTVNKTTRQIFTQGDCFSFKAGDVLYNNKLGYEDWSKFLKGDNPVILQVEYALPSGNEIYSEYSISGKAIKFQRKHKNKEATKTAKSFSIQEHRFNHGIVAIKEFRPNAARTAIQEVNSLNLTQDEFISLLQKGKYYERETKNEIDLRYQN